MLGFKKGRPKVIPRGWTHYNHLVKVRKSGLSKLTGEPSPLVMQDFSICFWVVSSDYGKPGARLHSWHVLQELILDGFQLKTVSIQSPV